MTSRVFVGKALALHVAGVGGLPELATRHHPAEMEAVVAQWLASDRDAVCFNPHALDQIPREQAHRIVCVALIDGAVRMQPITENAEWSWFCDVDGMLPGEFWSSFGEEWVGLDLSPEA